MAVISPNPALNDLKLTFHESTLVSPPPSPSAKSLYLSNIDQILNYSIPTVFFFPPNPQFPPEIVTQKLRTALQRVLLTYDFMAGRLHLNPDLGRLEILCNAAGAGFVVASSQSTLADLGDLVCPNPPFQQLALQTLKGDNVDDQPLFILQVTSFKCGGFAIGMSVNHILLDGISAKAFKQNLASQAFEDDRPLAVVPYLNRHLLAARSPPQVEFPHPEFFKPDPAPNSSGPLVFDCKREELDFRVFRLTPADITYLKDKAAASSSPDAKISSYSVVVALVWRCKALSWSDSAGKEGSSSRVSTVLNVVDIRTRVKPALPEGYCGNAVLVAQTAAECGEMDEFGKVAEKVAKGPRGMGEEYVRSAIDWLEVNKGLPNGEYMVSSWLRLGFEEVEFPWGKTEHCGPVPNHRKDICWVFPTPGGVINALVALPPREMDCFLAHFLQFFPQSK